MLGSWSIVSACPEEDCKGVRGDETKLAAAGERRQTAPALQSRRPEGAPPEVTRLAFSSLKCSTGKGSILTFGLKINMFQCAILCRVSPYRIHPIYLISFIFICFTAIFSSSILPRFASLQSVAALIKSLLEQFNLLLHLPFLLHGLFLPLQYSNDFINIFFTSQLSCPSRLMPAN